jgi:hypothetical protein
MAGCGPRGSDPGDSSPDSGPDTDGEDALVYEVDLDDDASRLEASPGAYEWWNFLATDPARGSRSR